MPPIAYFFRLLKLKLDFDLILGPSWVALGTFWETFWSIFGQCSCMFVQGAILIDFSSIFEPSKSQKTLRNKLFFSIFAFSLPSLLRSILLRTWSHFGLQNRPKICPKRVFKGVENHIGFTMPSWAFKNHFFLASMAPTWPDFAPQDGSKLGPKSVQNRSRSRLRSGSWFWTDFGPILDRFWTDFWLIFKLFLLLMLMSLLMLLWLMLVCTMH